MLSLFSAFGLMASAISANKIILYALQPEFLVAVRMTGAGILLTAYMYLKPHHRMKWHAIKKYVPLILIVALFTTYFPSNLKAYALSKMPSGKMAFFGTLDPFVTALFSYSFFKEKLTFYKICGILLGFLGMMILIFGSAYKEQVQFFSVFSYAEFAALWSIVLSRFGWIQAQQLLKKNILNPVQLNATIMILGGSMSFITAFFRDQITVVPLKCDALPLFSMSFFSALTSTQLLIFFLIYTTVIGNAFGYTLYAHGLKRHSAMFVSLASFSIPLLVAFFGWVFLNEPLSVDFVLACLVTFLGLIVFYMDDSKQHQ